MEQQDMDLKTGRFDTDDIGIRDIFHILRLWWWKIVALAIIFSIGAYFYAMYTYVPYYTTSATMVINSKQLKIVGQEVVTSNDINLSQKLVDTYSIIMKSNKVMELVAEDLGIDLPVQAIRSGVTVTSAKETEVLSIAVRNTDPELAAKIANSIIKVAPEVISKTVEVGSIKVVDYAKIPRFPEPPDIARDTAVGAALGLMVGVGLAFFFRLLNNTVKNEEDARRLLRLTMLGGIPFIRPRIRKGKVIAPLITSKIVEPGFSESYKAVRTSLQYASVVSDARCILVTSALNGEGKTTVSINLAISIAQSGKKVLLLDCDLRKSSVHEKLGIKLEKDKGLTSVLLGDRDVKDCIAFYGGAGLYVLPSGNIPPNPSELLGSEKMGKLLEGLKKEYDYLIMDTPPCHIVTDAVSLSKYSDGIIFVLKQGYAPIDVVNSSLDYLKNTKTSILGCILNGIKYREAGAHYKYRYYRRYYRNYSRQPASSKHDLSRRRKPLRARINAFFGSLLKRLAGGWMYIALTLAGLLLIGVALWGYINPLYQTARLLVQPAGVTSVGYGGAPGFSGSAGYSTDYAQPQEDGAGMDDNEATGEETESKNKIVYPHFGEQYATIIIPSVKINRPVFFGDTREQLLKGIGHYSGSYFPGEGGTIVYAGHNNVMFSGLKNVKEGDDVLVQTNYGSFKYRIYDVQVINKNNTQYIDPKKDREILVMYTCYPFNTLGFKANRYVVFAEPVKENTDNGGNSFEAGAGEN